MLNAVRRFGDLQAGSIWSDLAAELPGLSGTLVDAGCGAQPYRELLPAAVSYVAIDTSDAPPRFGYRAGDTRYYSGTTWPVETGSADIVLCTETLEHVAEPSLFLAEMRRCLRSRGRILITVPFAARWHFIPYDYWRFTPSGLDRLLTQAGFEAVTVHARGNALTVACYKLMALFLPFLFPRTSNPVSRVALRLLGVLCVPSLALLALLGWLSLRWPGGDDCLGYTVLAERSDDRK